jgi:hypothetical protein
METLSTFAVSNIGAMTFSEMESAFFFPEHVNMQGLWRLDWENGQPVGSPYFVKNIGSGEYIGIATVPEPTTLLLLSLGGMMLRMKR